MTLLWAAVDGKVLYKHPDLKLCDENLIQEAIETQKSKEAAPGKVNSL